MAMTAADVKPSQLDNSMQSEAALGVIDAASAHQLGVIAQQLQVA